MRHVVVMVTTSYPRFAGDSVGTFMEPIATHVAARGHEVHIVAPWHPLLQRGREERGVFFHFFKYAPLPSLNVFGYAAGMHADVQLRSAAWIAAPLALGAGWFKAMRVAQKRRATIMHAHWVVPGGVIGAAAAPGLPLVVSLHGSDVFVAERVGAAPLAARGVFGPAGAGGRLRGGGVRDGLQRRPCAARCRTGRLPGSPRHHPLRRRYPSVQTGS